MPVAHTDVPRLRLGDLPTEKITMNTMLLKGYLKLQNLIDREEGQDLVEYALLVSLIALAAIAATKSVASAITTIFNNISSTIA
jgi:pilus assembly protein Flp/PilA